MVKRKYTALLILLTFLSSIFSTGWYVRESWQEEVRKRNLKISKLKNKVTIAQLTGKKMKQDFDKLAADKAKEIDEQKQNYENELAGKNEELNVLRQELSSRGQQRNEKVQKIRNFLRSHGSPMAPTAEQLVWISESYQIDPYLLVGIAGVESSYGVHCYGHNPFGYLQSGAGSGLRRYQSWVEGYIAICEFIRSHWGKSGKIIYSARQLKGYCVPDYPWMDKVEAIRTSL